MSTNTAFVLAMFLLTMPILALLYYNYSVQALNFHQTNCGQVIDSGIEVK